MKKLILITIIILLSLVCCIKLTQADYPKNPSIRTGVMTYSSSEYEALFWAGSHFDLCVNAEWEDLDYDTIKAGDPDTKIIRYATFSTYRGPDVPTLIPKFLAEYPQYDYDDLFLWVDTGDSICINAVAPDQPPCTTTDSVLCIWDATNEDTVKWCGFSQRRYAPDLTKEAARKFIIWKFLYECDPDSDGVYEYDGIMEDEANGWYNYTGINDYGNMMCFPLQDTEWSHGSFQDVAGWDGYSNQQCRDSLVHLKQNTWLPEIVAACSTNNLLGLFPNMAAYGVPNSDLTQDVYQYGSGILFGEYLLISPLQQDFWNPVYVDSMFKLVISNDRGRVIVWYNNPPADTAALGSWHRGFMERLCHFYSFADTGHFFFMMGQSGDNNFNIADTIWWQPILHYDIGQPDSARFVDTTGTDGASQAFTVYRREFTRDDGEEFMILYRARNGSNYSSASNVTIDLPDTTWMVIDADSIKGSPLSSVDIKNVEGIILQKSSGEPEPPTKYILIGSE